MSDLHDDDVISVGDTVWIVGQGEQVVARLTVALRPSVDPAAEEYRVDVDAAERALPLVVTTESGRWAYGPQISQVMHHA